MEQTILLARTKTIAMMVLIAIATVGAIGKGTSMQSAQAFPEINPSTGNPHPYGEPTGNPHQSWSSCDGNPHGQLQRHGFGFHQCPGAQ